MGGLFTPHNRICYNAWGISKALQEYVSCSVLVISACCRLLISAKKVYFLKRGEMCEQILSNENKSGDEKAFDEVNFSFDLGFSKRSNIDTNVHFWKKIVFSDLYINVLSALHVLSYLF